MPNPVWISLFAVGLGIRMTRGRKVILAVAGIIIAAIAVGAFRFYRFVDYDLESPRIAVSSSPDKSRSAYLIWHGGLMARTLTLLVSPSNSGNDLRWIGSVDSDDSLTFTELVWSGDSNLVAARCIVGGYNERLPQGVSNNLFTHGYDFSASKRFASPRDVFDTPEAWTTHHGQLEQLLFDHGGGLTVVSQDNLDEKTSKMKWRKWCRWRKRLRTARNREANNASEGIHQSIDNLSEPAT